MTDLRATMPMELFTLCMNLPTLTFFVSLTSHLSSASHGVRRTICHIHYFVGASDMSSKTTTTTVRSVQILIILNNSE